MAGTVQQRAAGLLRRLLAERGTTAEELASLLGARGVELRRMLAGEGGIELDRLDGVLAALEVSPGDFFARLYAPSGPAAAGSSNGPEPAAAEPPSPPSPEDEPITRREVEDLLGELRATIHGMVRLIDAEREAAAPRPDPDD